MHINTLTISFLTAHYGSYNHKLSIGSKIPDASFVFVTMSVMDGQVELQSRGENGENEKETEE
jgi:hypothetical protein